MTTISTDQLCICIQHPAPRERKDELIQALAAAIRWRANYDEEYKGDAFNLLILSQLLADLSEHE